MRTTKREVYRCEETPDGRSWAAVVTHPCGCGHVGVYWTRADARHAAKANAMQQTTPQHPFGCTETHR